MSVTGLDQVVGRLKLVLEDAKGERTNKAITEMLIIGGENSAVITPIDTSTLINSQGRQLWETPTGQAGALYYGAKYAKWVHNMPGKLKGQLRNHFGRTRAGVDFGGGTQTGRYWDTDAEPQFLRKGMEQMAQDAQKILKKHYAVD